jgi:hypothetical protein
MQYRTEINITELFPKINPKDKITLLGSCFSDYIGKKLMNCKFSASANPLGTIFNPISIANIISDYLLRDTPKIEKDLWIENGIVSHPDFHSNNNTLDKKTFVENLTQRIRTSADHLKSSKTMILTLGTAWAYMDIELNRMVANCHKRPQNKFKKYLLSIEEIVDSLSNCINNLNICTILTVSPVRHIKNGIVENSRSKCRLVEACHILTESIEHCHYFPSYELMMDDLRDYRFYGRDMIHPSDQAIDYIWDSFVQYAFNRQAVSFKNIHEKLHQAVNHRPMIPQSEDFISFCNSQRLKIKSLQKEYPFVNYEKELDHFNQYLDVQ